MHCITDYDEEEREGEADVEGDEGVFSDPEIEGEIEDDEIQDQDELDFDLAVEEDILKDSPSGLTTGEEVEHLASINPEVQLQDELTDFSTAQEKQPSDASDLRTLKEQGEAQYKPDGQSFHLTNGFLEEDQSKAINPEEGVEPHAGQQAGKQREPLS